MKRTTDTTSEPARLKQALENVYPGIITPPVSKEIDEFFKGVQLTPQPWTVRGNTLYCGEQAIHFFQEGVAVAIAICHKINSSLDAAARVEPWRVWNDHKTGICVAAGNRCIAWVNQKAAELIVAAHNASLSAAAPAKEEEIS